MKTKQESTGQEWGLFCKSRGGLGASERWRPSALEAAVLLETSNLFQAMKELSEYQLKKHLARTVGSHLRHFPSPSETWGPPHTLIIFFQLNQEVRRQKHACCGRRLFCMFLRIYG
jgi:hypothetical protein